MKRSSTALWKGSGKEGTGTISTDSGVVKDASYTWKSRFQEPHGTSPEELIAAAHAACFCMKLSFVLGNHGFVPESIETTATVSIHEGSINNSHLLVKVKAPGISKEKFEECADDAKANCPVSKVLNTHITMEAQLI